MSSLKKTDRVSEKMIFNLSGVLLSAVLFLCLCPFPASADTSIVKLSSLKIIGVSSIQSGKSSSYTCTACYSNKTTKTVDASWKSSNTKVADFEANTLHGKKKGSVTITASYGGKKATKKVTITEPALVSLAISGESSINMNSSATYTCTAKFDDGSSKTVKASWKSSNSGIASFNSSKLTGKTVGTVIITAAYNGLKSSKSVIVAGPRTLRIEGADTLSYGKSATMVCKAVWTNGKAVKVTPKWSVTGTILQDGVFCPAAKVASVSSSGVVKYKKQLTNESAVITVQAVYGGFTAEKSITLMDQYYISGPDSLNFGKSGTYYLYQNGKKVTSNAVSWRRSGSYTEITDKGSYAVLKVTKKPESPVEETVTAKYNGKCFTITVTVK